MSIKQFKDMIQMFLDDWQYLEQEDTHGCITIGLKHLAKSNVTEDDIQEHLSSLNDWDGLENWAFDVGQSS